MSMRILALSSSRKGNEAYLQTASKMIGDFLNESTLSIAFVAFASADNDYEAYANKVREGLSVFSKNIITVLPSNAKAAIEKSDVIMIGGGNTFKLLHDLYELELIELIKEKVQSGTPYIGWSAGSNLTGPTICTTNDMPIIQPKSFASFDFFPFQINPHYHNIVMEGFNGETREQRLQEFLKLNQDKKVVCLPEGTALKLEGKVLKITGSSAGVLMWQEENFMQKEIQPQTDLSFLL